jgi:hypothetical protein
VTSFSVFGQFVQSPNAERFILSVEPESFERRGAMYTESRTFLLDPVPTTPFGRAVKVIVCFAAMSLSSYDVANAPA